MDREIEQKYNTLVILFSPSPRGRKEKFPWETAEQRPQQETAYWGRKPSPPGTGYTTWSEFLTLSEPLFSMFLSEEKNTVLGLFQALNKVMHIKQLTTHVVTGI